MKDIKFTFKTSDSTQKMAENICRINREANLDGIYYESITIRSLCPESRSDELMATIKKIDVETFLICEIVKNFY